MNAEGWYLDPFQRHEQRWFSNGAPTALVRSNGIEARDEPPTKTYAGPLVEAPSSQGNGDDLRRVDGGKPFAMGDVLDAGARAGVNPWDGPM